MVAATQPVTHLNPQPAGARVGKLALGVTNHVIRPRNWDDAHKRVKTDRTDTRAMLTALDRLAAGNKHALALVRVRTEE